MSRFRDISTKHITAEQWRKAILRRRIGNILEGYKTGWLSTDEAKERIINAFEEYQEFVDKDKK